MPINYIVARRVATGTRLAAHLNSVISPYQVDAPLVDDLILEGNKQGSGGNSMLLLKLTNGIYVHIHIHTHRLSLTHIHSKQKQMHITRNTIHACTCTHPLPPSQLLAIRRYSAKEQIVMLSTVEEEGTTSIEISIMVESYSPPPARLLLN